MIKLLEEKYQKKVIIYNDMYLFFNSVAKDFIHTCKNYNIHIDSLDAFSITGRGIQPAISNSISFPKTSNCWEEAILFLSKEENLDFLYYMRYGMQDTNINYIMHDGKKRTTRIQEIVQERGTRNF